MQANAASWGSGWVHGYKIYGPALALMTMRNCRSSWISEVRKCDLSFLTQS